MIYGYIRVSTDRQTVENQRFEIKRFCSDNGLQVDKWISETTSGAKKVNKRRLGKLLKGVKKDDIIICSEIRVQMHNNEVCRQFYRYWHIFNNIILHSPWNPPTCCHPTILVYSKSCQNIFAQQLELPAFSQYYLQVKRHFYKYMAFLHSLQCHI